MQLFNFSSVYIILDVIAVFLLLFFAAFLFSIRTGNLLRQRLLATFFIVLSLSYMDGLFISLNVRLYFPYPHIVHFSMSFDYLVGPVLYLYILAMTKENFKLKSIYFLQAIPFCLHFLFLAYLFISQKQGGIPDFSRTEIMILSATSSLHLFIYIGLIVHLLLQYKDTLKSNYSDTERYSLSWLTLISCGLFIASILRVLNNFLWLTVPETMFNAMYDLKVFAIFSVFVFACTVIFKSLKQPICLDYSKKVKYKSSPLSSKEKQNMLDTIQGYMKQHSPYLNASFNLKDLAEGVDLKPHQVSQVLNTQLNQNFFDFVNSYRIKDSQILLIDENSTNKNITQIMYETGFNSKSVFNTVFKKTTGVTPSQFRKTA